MRVIRVIAGTERRGEGTDDNPNRRVRQLWTIDGQLLAEYDPHTEAGWISEEAFPAIPGPPRRPS